MSRNNDERRPGAGFGPALPMACLLAAVGWIMVALIAWGLWRWLG